MERGGAGGSDVCIRALALPAPTYVTLGKSLTLGPQFSHLWNKDIDSPGPSISDSALDFVGFVSGTKKTPTFWLKLLSNFQLVKVQCWLPFASQDVWAKISTDNSNGKHTSKMSPLALLVLGVQ